MIPPARADSVSGATASQLRPMNDHRHEHLPTSPGVIPSPRTDLASSPTASLTASQLRSPSDHSHGPLPVSPGVISRADLASGPAVPSTTSRLRSASSSAQSSTTSALLSPLGPALTSFLSASPSPPRHPALRNSPRLSRLFGVAFRLLLWLRLFLPARVPSVLFLLAILFT